MPGVRHTLVPLDTGTRVIVRYSLAGDGSPPWTDAVGDLISQDTAELVVRTRSGLVTVPRAGIVAAKPIPPAVARKARS